MKKSHVAYVALAFVVMLVPSVGLVFGGAELSSDADEATTAGSPQVINEDGSFNPYVLSEAGEWFEQHFAFRNEWITACSALTSTVFQTSSVDNVICGTNGWLYYGNSLGEYQATEALSDRALFDIAHSMKRMQEYAQEHGAQFVFTIAPDKNSLYDANMPYYYKGFIAGERNLARLEKVLEDEGVNYVDLYACLSEQAETSERALYHARDSHWTNEGAAMAADELLSALEQQHPDYSTRDYEIRNDYVGDLDEMASPSLPTAEDELYYDPEPAFEYEGEVESNFDSRITTHGSGSGGSLLMYRDSFGNALLPFMAECYEDAFFTRGVPYQLSTDLLTCGADVVVVERAERFLTQMASEAPAVPASVVDAPAGVEFTAVGEVQAQESGVGYTMVTGTVPDGVLDDAGADALLYVRVNGGICYEAFGTCVDGEEQFTLMVPSSVATDGTKYEICAK